VSNQEDIPLHTSSSSLILSRTESSTPRLNVVDLKVLRHTAATMDAGCERASVGESARKLRLRRYRRVLLDKANIFLSQCTSATIFFFVRRASCSYRRPSHSQAELMQAWFTTNTHFRCSVCSARCNVCHSSVQPLLWFFPLSVTTRSARPE
jgi:hypothetical protein